MILKEPTDEPLPLHLAVPASNEMIQAFANTNVKDVHAAVNSITIRHVQPVLEVRVSSVTTPGYVEFNSTTNPIFDSMLTMATKMASLNLDHGTFITPGTVYASSNPWYYSSSKFGDPANVSHVNLTRPGYYGIPNAAEQAAGTGHNSPRFWRKAYSFL